jgi:hypothetical protein
MNTTDIDWTPVKSQTSTVTYNGSRARVTTELATKRALGLRRITMEWLDDAPIRNGGHKAGTVVTRVVEGDGRTSDFRVLAEEVTVR